MKVEWKDIQGYEGYYSVSSNGTVVSNDRHVAGKDGSKKLCTGKMLTIHWKRGYGRVTLSKEAKHKSFFIHRLVANAFLGNQPGPKYEVNHINGVKNDNRVANLEWITRTANIHHSIRTGLAQYGDTFTRDKEIFEKLNNGSTPKELAEFYGISVPRVTQIRIKQKAI